MQASVPNPGQNAQVALVRLYSGMAYRDIGEYFCYAAYNAGPAVAREQSLAIALEHLTEAITIAEAAGADSIASMGRLSRARINLSLGRNAEALTDARAVPAGFRWLARYREAPGEFNGAFSTLNQVAQGTVSTEYANAGDPRVRAVAAGTAPDGATPRFNQEKFTRFSNISRGKWQEARLIEAEILIGQNQIPAAMALINQVRTAAGLAALSTMQTTATATTALRNERRNELFLEGNRMLDMRRWGLFPTNWQASCVLPPRAEMNNNPNL